MTPRKRRTSSVDSIQLFGAGQDDASLLDLIDNVLNHGVVLQGDLILGVANVDLIYAQLSLLLATVDRIAGPSPAEPRRLSGRSSRRK